MSLGYTQNLLQTLKQLADWNISIVAMSGMTFELNTPRGRMMATMLAGIAQFEHDLLSERVKSGLATNLLVNVWSGFMLALPS